MTGNSSALPVTASNDARPVEPMMKNLIEPNTVTSTEKAHDASKNLASALGYLHIRFQ